MKILVCTDGSKQSEKALEQASLIAEGCNVTDVAIIHVYEKSGPDFRSIGGEGYTPTQKETERLEELHELEKEERKKILSDALKIFEEKNINARTILKEGHPSETIVSVGCNEGFDIIVIGSRGMGSLQKVFLGSVSNAVVQQAKNCSVLTVK